MYSEIVPILLMLVSQDVLVEPVAGNSVRTRVLENAKRVIDQRVVKNGGTLSDNRARAKLRIVTDVERRRGSYVMVINDQIGCRDPELGVLFGCLQDAVDTLMGLTRVPVMGRVAMAALQVPQNAPKGLQNELSEAINDTPGVTLVAEAEADYLLRGGASEFDEDVWVVDLFLIDRNKKVVARGSEVYRGSIKQLGGAIHLAAHNLIGRPVTGAGKLQLKTPVERGTVSIDGDKQPLNRTLDGNLPTGKHHLRITSPEFYPHIMHFYVFKDQTTTLIPKMEPIPEPWYEKWYVWVSVGAAVAISAGVVGYAAANRPEDAVIDISIRD